MHAPSPRPPPAWLAALALACARPSAPARAPASPAEASPADRPAATPTPPSPPAPPVAGAIGTEHPILVQAVAADGRWVAACQARMDTDGTPGFSVDIGPHGDPYGDALTPYLFIGPGEGLKIDDLLAEEPGGSRVATIEGGALTLRDTRSGELRKLDTGDLTGRARLVGFDGRGHLIHLRHADPERRQVVVHDLASGAELVLDRGPGRLVHAWLDRTAPWVGVTVDLPLAGKYLARRAPRTTAYGGPCRGPAAVASTFGGGGGGPTATRLLPVAGGPPREVAGLVGILGGDAIVRRDDRSLWREPLAGGSPLELVEAGCDARVEAVSLASGALLVACRRKRDQDHLAVELRGLGPPRELGWGSGYPAHDNWGGGDDAWDRIFLRDADALVDLVRGRVVRKQFRRVQHSDGIVAQHGERVLIRRELGLLWFDVDDGAEHPLPGEIVPYPNVHQRGPIVAVEPLIVDLAAGAVLGATSRPALGVAATGHVLTPARPLRPGQRVPDGPLGWTSPEPLP